MVDQKELRDMMKKEKERRQAEKNALKQKLKEKADEKAMPPPSMIPIPAKKRAAVPEAPATGSSPASSSDAAAMPPPAVPLKKADAASMPPPPVPVFKKAVTATMPASGTSASSSKPTSASPDKGAILGLGSYDDDSDEEGAAQEPPAKRPHTAAPNGVVEKQVDYVVVAGAGASPAPPATNVQVSAGSSQAIMEVEKPKPAKPLFEPVVQIGLKTLEGRELEGDAKEEPAEEEPKSAIPSGFFDDPEEDAKVRGEEGPSAKKSRELEEGLKLFEKQMEQEVEKSEATRHELDEQSYERNFDLEQQKQKAYWQKLEQLRQMREKKLTEAASASAANAAAANDEGTGDADDDEGDSSGSDLDFDWRSKAVG